MGIILRPVEHVKLELCQKLVVVAGWLGVSSKAGMLRGLQVPWSDFVGLTGGGAANATRDKIYVLESCCRTTTSVEVGPADRGSQGLLTQFLTSTITGG